MMKIAIVGSRGLYIHDFKKYLPDDITEIISGGAKGIDTCAKRYALKYGIRFIEILPDYAKYGKSAPLKRNDIIIEMADAVLAIWDGRSAGTKYVINKCRKTNKSITIINIEKQ